jgi:transcriptional regulator with XRE-family HTH domain
MFGKEPNLKHDATKLKLLRESMGMTQEKLAILSSVSERTVQRAEAGAKMSLETLNDFAAALEVPLSELVFDPDETSADATIALRRVETARSVLDDLGRATAATFDCEFDPIGSELETVLALVSLIESRLPNPWDHGPEPLTLRDKIQLSATASAYLETLKSTGIGLYSSASWISAKVPRFDLDEGHFYTHDRQKYERVMTLQILLSRSMEDRIYRKSPNGWGLDEASPPKPVTFDFDDDVPF